MKQILTLTVNPAVDKSTSIDRVMPEHKLRCRNPDYEPGGGGINVSRAIKKLGGTSVAFCTAGGLNGGLLESLLQKEEISHHPIPIREWTRESLAVFEESTGLQYRFGMEGPTLREDEWELCLDMVLKAHPRPDYIVGSGALPPESLTTSMPGWRGSVRISEHGSLSILQVTPFVWPLKGVSS